MKLWSKRSETVPTPVEPGRRVARRRSALLVPALALVLAAPQQCASEEEPAEPGDPTSPPAGGAASLAELDPCQLLTAETAPQVGIQDVTTGEPVTSNAYRQCNWQVDGATADDSYLVVVGISETLTLDGVVNDLGAAPVLVGSHDAAQAEAAGNCTVYVGAGDTGLVANDVSGGAAVDLCGLAGQVAALVEPQVP